MKEYTIISDLHLGSNVCRADELLNFLDNLETKTLILNGDVFDNLDFRRLQKSHWKILKRIRKIADEIKVIWIKGNHDTDKAELIAHLLGVDFLEDLIINPWDKTILITHGDRWDTFIKERPLTSKIADYVYRLIQSFDKKFNKDYYYSNLVKSKSKVIIRCGMVVENAINYCRNNNIDTVICGHTHMACLHHHLTKNEKVIEYWNSGSWTDKNCHYITIDKDEILLDEFCGKEEQLKLMRNIHEEENTQ
jgi:UDP-2,3-diacylglucosamine pyrophosphatase LpxH